MAAKKKSKGGLWNMVKKVFLVIFVLHVTWFLVFIIKKIKVEGFTIEHLGLKLFVLFLVICGIAALYFFKLRKIKTIHTIGVWCREIFFIYYITTCCYLVAGFVINPLITLTQLTELIKGNGLKRDYISYADMGAQIKLAAIAAEDQLFPDHDGFDVKAIKKAVKYNGTHEKKQRGGSTISQQTAKNIFLWQGGGFFRKGLEVFYTFTIEKCWSKKIILERYLNIAEMGRGIFGVQAAAITYFSKDAKNLTAEEAAKIVACFPNPKKYTVIPQSKYVAARYKKILVQMNRIKTDPDVKALL